MSDEKPLHVRVAEALGWTDIRLGVWHTKGCWTGRHPVGGAVTRIPRYDIDWSATGPLIERYGLGAAAAVQPWLTGDVAHASTCIGACGEYCALPEMAGVARIKDMPMGPHRPFMACSDDTTPLRAVCVLIVALADAGKLDLLT